MRGCAPDGGCRLAYVGCRTTRARNARGAGIAVFRVSDHGRVWDRIQLLGDVVNPSFLACDPRRGMLYAVHGDGGEASALRLDPADGRLTRVNQVSCRGCNPVHLTLDPGGRHLIVANHITREPHVSGLAVLPLGSDGALGDVVDLVPLTGQTGPHRVEQPFAKPHQVVFDPAGRFLAVADKGLDAVMTFRLDHAGKLRATDAPPARSREGAGPRHLVFHPVLPYVFVLNELSSTVMACAYDPDTGAITPHQELPALPDTFMGFSRGAEIAISADGRFVYASNRGHESVASFRVDARTGRLIPQSWTGCQGRTPRFFTLDPAGTAIFVANEDSDTIVRFSRDAGTGALSDPLIVARTGSPTCIVFAS